jgi:hypothetical protein
MPPLQTATFENDQLLPMALNVVPESMACLISHWILAVVAL